MSRDGAADGVSTVDRSLHVKALVGFNSDDSLTFRIDGNFFDGFEFSTTNKNQVAVSTEDIDVLGAFLIGKGAENNAFYDSTTNSTVLVIDDSPTNPSDNIAIVLYNAGDLL